MSGCSVYMPAYTAWTIELADMAALDVVKYWYLRQIYGLLSPFSAGFFAYTQNQESMPLWLYFPPAEFGFYPSLPAAF
jgi:hypothetical protein